MVPLGEWTTASQVVDPHQALSAVGSPGAVGPSAERGETEWVIKYGEGMGRMELEWGDKEGQTRHGFRDGLRF